MTGVQRLGAYAVVKKAQMIKYFVAKLNAEINCNIKSKHIAEMRNG